MKIYTLALLSFMLVSFTNPKKKTSSTIEEVTVYLTGAQIKRIAEVNLKPGINEITLHDLSPTINQNSIQVSGLQNTSILSINYTIDHLKKKQNSEELESLNNNLELLLLKKNKLENIILGLSQEKKIIDQNQKIGSDTAPISLEKIKEISTYYRERSIMIQNEIYALNLKKNSITDDIYDLQSEITKLDDHKEKRGEIKLKLDADTATNLILEIRYNVTNAGWFPLYDIKSKNTETPINIAYKANVYQQTGTNWNDVKVILSTGDPNTNNLKPNLQSKYLNFINSNYQNNKAIRNYSYKYNPLIRNVSGIVSDQRGQPLPGVNIIEKGTSNGTQTDFDGRYSLTIQKGKEISFSYLGFSNKIIPIYSSTININLEEDASQLDEVVIRGYSSSSIKRKKQEEKKDYNQIVATKEVGITHTRFKIKKKYSIRSNADVIAIEIDNFDMPVDYRHYVAPELNENVFLTAKLGNWEKFNLLAGEANIYFEGSFAGKTNIDPLATTDSLTISLGVDPNIIVSRKQSDNFKSKSFTGSNKIIQQGYITSIKNNKQNKIHITLEDRIPVSHNKEIKLDDLNTNSALFDTKTGILQWKLEILPHQSIEKQFSYQVKYPKNKQINL